MSYRLINANAIAANCKQVNDMPCIYADLPNGLDGNHYIIEQSGSNRESHGARTSAAIDGWMAVKDGRKSRYEKLFGTPENAARTLRKNGKSIPACYACLVRDECVTLPEGYDECPMDDYDALLEWLRGDA